MRRPSFRHIVQGVCFSLLVLASFFICYWSVRFAAADFYFRGNTLETLREAVRLAPGNAIYHSLLAEHEEGVGMDPAAELATAASLSPHDARVWIRLGFRSETLGRYEEAERCLIRAAGMSRRFDSRWALMNFYFRRHRQDLFWVWARKSLEIGDGDLTPVFRLMWNMADRESTVRANMPPGNALLLQYFYFLRANEYSDPASSVAPHIASFIDAVNLPVMLSYLDSAIARNNPLAISIWNTLCSRRMIPFEPLDPIRGNIVADENLLHLETPRAFAWIPLPVAGVSVVPSDEGPGLALTLTGNQPEDCAVLTKVLPVVPGSEYTLRYAHRSSVSSPGIMWEITDLSPDRNLPPQVKSLDPAPTERVDALTFRAGSGHYMRLTLKYQRRVGSMRAEGLTAIRSIRSGLGQ